MTAQQVFFPGLELVPGLEPELDAAGEQVFLRLGTLGEGRQYTRRRVALG